MPASFESHGARDGALVRRFVQLWIAAMAAALGAPALAQVAVTVPGTANPYLAGMPNGSTCCGGDSAPAQSPVQVVGIPVTPGAVLTFSATGGVHFEAGPLTPTPDGGPVFTTVQNNGISGITWPEDSLAGVFLGNDPPNLTAAPGALNFGGGGLGTGFATLSPALKQVFFIGDGRTGTGAGAVQTFVVPAGATRLFLGVSDGFGWFNNVGSFTVTVAPATPAAATPSDIPTLSSGALALLAAALAVMAMLQRRRR